MNADRLNGLSERIHKCSFTLANMLGCGLLEKELRKAGLAVAQQRGIVVTYDGMHLSHAPGGW